MKSKANVSRKRKVYKKRSGSGGKSIAALRKKVNKLAMTLQPEKKRFNVFSSVTPFGQCDNTMEAPYILDITPNPAQGVGVNAHIGAAIKLCSVYIEGQIQHQANTAGPIRVRCYLINIKGTPVAASQWLKHMFNANPFITGAGVTGLRDYNSSRQIDYMANYKVLKTKTLYIQPDQISGINMPKSFRIGHKFKNTHEIHYDGNTNTVLSGQLFYMMVTDGGNISASVSTLGGIPYTAALTGLTASTNITEYFYDM